MPRNWATMALPEAAETSPAWSRLMPVGGRYSAMIVGRPGLLRHLVARAIPARAAANSATRDPARPMLGNGVAVNDSSRGMKVPAWNPTTRVRPSCAPRLPVPASTCQPEPSAVLSRLVQAWLESLARWLQADWPVSCAVRAL